MSNSELAEELHKPIIRKFGKRKVYSSFKENIWGADLADMQLISKFNKWFWFILCVIDNYAGVVLLNDNKNVLQCITIANAFQKILGESNCKISKISVDKGSEFYNRLMKSWFQYIYIYIYIYR